MSTVSVLLVVRDGAATLPAVLDALAAQRFDGEIEVVAVDSGSTDGSTELLRGRVERLLRVEPASFDHGATRNLGIESCRGELVALLVQDAEPADERWLAALVEPLRSDPKVAGAYSRQRPRPDASAVTRLYLDRWVAASETPHVAELGSPEALAELAPAERYRRCVFDNVSSCLRREAWTRHPFPPARFGEDLAWARTVMLAGWRIAYAPASVVVHSHERSAAHELRRTIAAHRQIVELFAWRTIPTLPLLLRAMAGSLAAHLRCVGAHGRPGAGALWRAAALAVAYPLGQYLGGRAGARAIASR